MKLIRDFDIFVEAKIPKYELDTRISEEKDKISDYFQELLDCGIDVTVENGIFLPRYKLIRSKNGGWVKSVKSQDIKHHEFFFKKSKDQLLNSDEDFWRGFQVNINTPLLSHRVKLSDDELRQLLIRPMNRIKNLFKGRVSIEFRYSNVQTNKPIIGLNIVTHEKA